MVSIKYPFPPVMLMWVHLLRPSLHLNELCTSVAIRDLSRSCEIDAYKVEKSYVCIDVACMDIQLIQGRQQVFNNPHVVDSFTAVFSATVPD